MTNKEEKNISCRAPKCDQKFASTFYMQQHMRRIHGVSAKLLSPASKSRPAKKGTIKTEPTEY